MSRPRRPPRGRPSILIAIIVLALVLGVLTSRPGDKALYPPAVGAPRTTIYLIDNGFHSDIALPRSAVAGAPTLAKAAAATTDAPWVLVGWGDERFYEGQGVSLARLGDALRALFWPDNAAVVHLEGVAGQPDMAFQDAHARAIELSGPGLQRLEARIDQSFARDGQGLPERAPGSAWADEAFFLSNERFGLFHLCNHWTAQALNAAGLPVSLALDTLPAGLRLDLDVRARLAGGPAAAR